MKRLFGAAIVLLIAGVQPGLADDCQERFVLLLVNGNGDGPAQIHITQEIKGAPATVNNFYQVSPDHWMTEVIEPANQPRVLAYDNAMYTSSDGGKSWTKLRDTDPGGAAAAKANLEENARTARNAVCGEAALDGVTFDRVEADFSTQQNFKTENHYTYWIDRETGLIVRAVYETKGQGFESRSTQIIEPAPGLTLPTP